MAGSFEDGVPLPPRPAVVYLVLTRPGDHSSAVEAFRSADGYVPAPNIGILGPDAMTYKVVGTVNTLKFHPEGQTKTVASEHMVLLERS